MPPEFRLYYKAILSKIFAQKHTHRSTEQNGEPRNKHIHVWSINLWQRRQEYARKKSLSPQKVVLWKLEATCKRVKLEHFSYYIEK